MICESIGFRDTLYNKLWEAACIYPISKAVYLESLEPHLLNEQLTDIPPSIVQEFVQHYCNSKKFMVSIYMHSSTSFTLFELLIRFLTVYMY